MGIFPLEGILRRAGGSAPGLFSNDGFHVLILHGVLFVGFISPVERVEDFPGILLLRANHDSY